jgi:hypothetical protein
LESAQITEKSWKMHWKLIELQYINWITAELRLHYFHGGCISWIAAAFLELRLHYLNCSWITLNCNAILHFSASKFRTIAFLLAFLLSFVKTKKIAIEFFTIFVFKQIFLYAWRSNLTTTSKKVKNSWNFQIFSICFLRWPVAVKADHHRYKICTFLKSGHNLQLEKIQYHSIGQPISLCRSV